MPFAASDAVCGNCIGEGYENGFEHSSVFFGNPARRDAGCQETFQDEKLYEAFFEGLGNFQKRNINQYRVLGKIADAWRGDILNRTLMYVR